MEILGGGSLQLVSALLILLHMQTSVGFNSTVGDDEVTCIESERQALLGFKHGLVDHYGLLSSWGTDEKKKDCCDWKGVKCSDTSGHVIELDLGGHSLRGNLSSSLFELQHLTYLDLSRNDFNLSHVPVSIGSLNKIRYLNLFGSDLSGSLSQLGNLTNLQFLSVSNNQFQGLIPETFCRMIYLEYLDLSFNQFGGKIPKSLFRNMCKLRHLDLSGDNLQAMLHEFIGNLSECPEHPLEFLALGFNQFLGPWPDLITNFSSLRALYLLDNKLSGIIPKSIRLLSKLELLHIASNSFEGELTEADFSSLHALLFLDMSFNHLRINFSRDWIPPFQLYHLGFGFCNLGPAFPNWLQTQRNLSYLDISANGISEIIPIWFWNLSSKITFLNLSSNQINGILPANLSMKFSSPLRQGIDLSGNKFEGPLPLFPTNTTYINLSQNRFSGLFSSLCAMAGSFLRFLDLSHNQLFGALPNCMMRWSSLKILNLANNHFSGEIPSSVRYLSSIETLDLQNNSLYGEIPWSLRNCSRLQLVDLSYNKFSGVIPDWIGERLSSLNFLVLKSNHFVGEIPLKICQLTNIMLLDLSNNNLTGTIPWCIGNMTALTTKKNPAKDHYFSSAEVSQNKFRMHSYADKAFVWWKGFDYDFKNITVLKIIDLSSNKLKGEIPRQIWSLFELVQLNLSRNHLTGSIPPDIGQLRQLESLDFSNNRLSGQLPSSMSLLNFLSHLDLSYNNFSGRIPPGTQMDTFNASAFAGNFALCGPPLTPTCPGDEKPVDSGVKHYQDEEDEFWRGFKPSIELGLAFGFVGVVAFKLDHPWKPVCFRLFNHLKVRLSNLKDFLCLIVGALYLVVTVNVVRLRRKFKF